MGIKFTRRVSALSCRMFTLLLFTLFILTSLTNLSAQSARVTGIVRDASGNGVNGASVNIKGSTAGTVTDSSGYYSLVLPSNKAVLQFSSTGFGTVEQIAGNRRSIDVTLTATTSNLDEVVVVGYGTQRKRDVTGAISSVNAAAIAQRQPVDVFDALQGQAAGVQIAQESGRPGAGSSIRIRGTATLEGGADPLYIVDGAQGVSIDGINPADIESIEILKDAASAAIYGSRSANGVIIITTKKGKEGRPGIDLRYLTSSSRLSRKVPQANAADRRLLDVKRSTSGSIVTPADSLNPGYNADNDYQDLLTQNAVRHQVDLGISGATKGLTYYASMGLLKEKGIIVNSWADIIRTRINIDYKPNEKFGFGTRIQASYQTENRINEGNTLGQAIQRPPNFRIYFQDGTLSNLIAGRRNPLAEALLRKNEFDIYNASIYNYISYNFSKALKLTVDANVRMNYQKNLQFAAQLLSSATPPINELSEESNLNTYWMTQAFLNYNKTFGAKHTLTGVLGVSADKENEHTTEIGGTNLVTETVQTLNSLQVLTRGDSREERIFSNSAFARLGYSFKGKYLFNSNFRADASSRFGKDNRWGFFPSASIGWRFSDEAFMAWSGKYLDDGKIRLSYGFTGNDRVGPYESIQSYTFSNTTSGNFYNGISGVAPNSLFGNNKLSWEEQKQFNVGIDLAFLKGRINFTADYYNKTTGKLLYSAPLPYETGFNTVKVNFGAIQNKGLEILLSGFPIRTKNLQWNVSYNMSFNNNTVNELYTGTTLLPGNPNVWKVTEGGRLGDFYGYRALGVYAYDESNAYNDNWDILNLVFNSGVFSHYEFDGKPYSGTVKRLTTQGNLLKGGDMIWENSRKDAAIDDADRMILGNAQPDWIAGLTNTFSYKGFSLLFSFYVSWGGTIYNRARQQLNLNATTNVTPEPDYIRQSWYKPGDQTIYPVAKNLPVGNGREGSSLYMEDASFIRFRNARLAYEVPRNLTSRVKMKNVSLFVYGNNLLTWTKYKWYDPEISLGSALTPGLDNGRYPRKREFGGGINVNF